MNQLDYWTECIASALDDCGLSATGEQIASIAEAVKGGHENIEQAFYVPPASDRLAVINSEWQAKFDRLQAEFDAYRSHAEEAVRKALRQFPDAIISIDEDGEVYRHNGRTERIQ